MLGDWVKGVNGLRSTNWHLQNSHGDVKYSNNTVTTIMVPGENLKYWKLQALNLLGVDIY